MNNLELLNHLKTKAKTEVVTTLGIFETKEVIPMSVIDDEIRAYNNHIRQDAKKPADKDEISEAINNALILQYEMDLANLPKYDIIHDLPEDYVKARQISLEVSIKALKDMQQGYSKASIKPLPTDKQIQDILVAYKRRDAFATGNSGTTLKRATEMIRELYE